MKSLLTNIASKDVRMDPFPHLVVNDVLDEDLCLRLVSEFPSVETITRGKDCGSNERFDYLVRDVRGDKTISPLWREFVEAHVSRSFLDDFFRLFGGAIRKLYPQFEERIGPFNSLRHGVRFIDTHADHDLLLDAHISINTPVQGRPSSVRDVHLDDPMKLYTALFYLRHPDDDSQGGNLLLYRYKGPKPKFFGQHIDHKYVEPIGTVPYKRNTLIMFVNSINSLHGVSPRHPTGHIRRFLNLVGEVKEPLFDIVSHQEGRLARRWRLLKNRVRSRRVTRYAENF